MLSFLQNIQRQVGKAASGIAAPSLRELPLEQKVNAFVFEDLKSETLVKLEGWIEALDVDGEAATGGCGLAL